MHGARRTVALLAFGFFTLATFSAVNTFVSTANTLSGLRSVTIKAFGSLSIDPGKTLLLSAHGDYVTYTVPVMALWSIVEGSNLGGFTENCDAAKECMFQAGQKSGKVKVRADSNGMSDQVTIDIRPAGPAVPVKSPFKDELPDWAGTAIVTLNQKNILRGYEDGRFGPGDSLTRGQLIAILYRMLTAQNLLAPVGECRIPYQDVPTGHYAYNAACALKKLGWLDALSTLEPDKPVDRMETAALLARSIGPALLQAKKMSLGQIVGQGQVFRDVPQEHSAFVDSGVLHALGVMKGNPDGTFQPKSILNRAEASTVMWRAMEELQKAGVRAL